MTLLDPQSEWARLMLATLADGGVTEVVLSPGSRSTPFALAAAAEPRMRITTIADERAAAFYALGQGRASGRPSLLLCTSGTAPAHWLPALLEARAAGVPLLALSADRPLEAQGAGASQTCDQLKLFGDAVLRYVELGGVEVAPAALRGLRRTLTQATAIAAKGPVHLNARARKPLEPRPCSEDERAASTAIHAARKQPAPRWFVAPLGVDERGLDPLAARIAEHPDGVFLCGPRSPLDPRLAPALAALARRAGWPVLAEATSCVDGDETPLGALSLLGTGPLPHGLQPRMVVQLGAQPVSSAAERLLAAATAVEIISPIHDVDADARALAVHVAEPALACARLEVLLADRGLDRGDAPFRKAWREATAARAAEVVLAPTDELAFVRALLDALPDANLVLGNSLPVREVDLACALGARAPGRVFHQRGLAGIDGLVAGAAGVASQAGRTVLLLGDVSLLHDLHGLLVAGERKAPLVVAVVNNGGGRIFETLPVGRDETLRSAMPLFTTPSAPELAALARFTGVRHVCCTAAGELAGAMAGAFSEGPMLLELRTDAGSAARVDAQLRQVRA